MSLNELAIDAGRWEESAPRAARPPAAAPGRRAAPILAADALRVGYPVVTAAGAAALFACGGFVPVLRRWLADEIRLGDPAAIVATLGGVWPKTEGDPAHADLGPVLGRREAAAFLEELDALARALGTAAPPRPRLTFLPCCGVVASGRRTRTLVVGLPLFQVLTRGELRAVVAHELAHLARGDAGRLAGAVRLVERLEEGLDAGAPAGAWRGGPLRAWARWSYRRGAGWVAPLARAQEERADRLAAALVGGDVAASALVRVALVQPIFREVLAHLDAERPVGGNLYATFAALWRRLPEDALTAMRHALLADQRDASPTHPRLIDRLAIVQAYASRPSADADAPAATLLADLEALQAAMHRRLFADERPQPSVFHRAGS